MPHTPEKVPPKTCRDCGASFTPTPNQIRTYCRRCRECLRLYKKEWRHRRAAEGRPVVAKKPTTEQRRRYAATYFSKEENRRKRSDNIKKWYGRPEEYKKINCRNTTQRMLRNGRLTRGPCEVCGCEKSQAHHDDYDHPETVRWLCAQHHKEHHMRLAAVLQAVEGECPPPNTTT